MGNRKLFLETENSFPSSGTKTSFQINPFIRKGELVVLTGENSLLVHDMGIGICSALSMKQPLFIGDEVIKTPNRQNVLYLNSGPWDSEDNTIVSDVVKNYIPGVGPTKQFNGQMPFAVCNMQHNLFAVGFWKDKKSAMLKKEMKKYDIVVINDFSATFSMKKMSVDDMVTFLTPYMKNHTTFVVLSFLGDEKLFKKADVVISMNKIENEERYKLTCERKNVKFPKPFFVKHEIINI